MSTEQGNGFKIVERPQWVRSVLLNKWRQLEEMVVETAKTGKAVEVPVEAGNRVTVRAAVNSWCARNHPELVIHSNSAWKDDLSKPLILWAEVREKPLREVGDDE